MATVINLNDLLRHEILDLYSAEEQILEALPKMIDKANNINLKIALSDHFKVTELQKMRLDQVKQLLGEKGDDENPGENKGFFSRLHGAYNGQKCKGTEGLIDAGVKMMGEDMSPEALDSAIIANAQKIEHYEISGYGTARAFARELNLVDVVGLLTQTLNEEYEADDMLTRLAVGRLNIDAEYATIAEENTRRSGNRRSVIRVGANSKPSNGKSKKSNSSKNARSGKNIGAGNGLFKSSPGSSKKSRSNSSRLAPKKITADTSRLTPIKSTSKSSSRLTPQKSAAKSSVGYSKRSIPKSSAGSSKKSASKSYTRPSPAKSASKSSNGITPKKSTSKSSTVTKAGSFKKSAVSGRSSAVKSAAKSPVKNKSAKKTAIVNSKNLTNKKSKPSGRR